MKYGMATFFQTFLFLFVIFTSSVASYFQMDLDIKKSLCVDLGFDIDKCVSVLEELSSIPMTPVLLRESSRCVHIS